MTGGAIRFGLAAIKGIGEMAVQSVLTARQAGGRFGTITDFCERVDSRAVNRKALEALVRCGACDGLGETRATLWNSLERVLARAANNAQDRARGQSSLFGLLEGPAEAKVDALTRMPDWPATQRLAAEKELLGFYVTGHPLARYEPILRRYTLATSSKLAALPNRSVTRLGGLVAGVQTGVSKKSGKPYALATIEDLEGSVQVLLLNENFDKFRELLVVNTAILVVGEVNLGEDKPKLFPQEILRLDDAPRKYTTQVHLRLKTDGSTPEKLRAVRDRLAAHRGKTPLFLCLIQPAGEMVFIEAHDDFRVLPSLELQQAVEELLGAGAYYPKVDLSLPPKPQNRWARRETGGEE